MSRIFTNKRKFFWSGIKNNQISSGIYYAQSQLLAEIELEQTGIILESIVPISIKFYVNKFLQKKFWINKTSFILFFTGNLLKLLKSGTDLVGSLQFIAQHVENNDLKKIVQEIMLLVSQGEALSKASARYDKYFDNFYCSLIYTAEQCGHLVPILEDLLNYQKNLAALKKNLVRSLIYPAFLLSSSAIIFVLIITFVIPEFKNIFTDFTGQLPFLTRMIISMTDNLANYAGLVSGIIIISILLLQLAKNKLIKVALFIDWFILRLPILGNLIFKTLLIKFTYTANITLQSGITMLESLKINRINSSNRYFAIIIERIITCIEEGYPLHVAIQKTGCFPHLLVHIITVSEKANNLEVGFKEIYQNYTEEIEQKLNLLNVLLEPILILSVTILFGILIVAMYLPVFKLGLLV